jgi:Family of unknown function (DUF5906)
MTENFEDQFTAEVFEPCEEGTGVTIDDFIAYMPSHVYIFMPSREPWPAASVNARVGQMPVLTKAGKPKKDKNGEPKMMAASAWLDQNRPVEQMTWAPGFPALIKDRLILNSGWIEREGVTTFNHYRPPRIILGDASKAGPWIDHVRRVYPDEADHIIMWLAQRVQRPEIKINHALVLGGKQGIGKDTLLEPVKHAVGPWNFEDVNPSQLLGRFNDFLKSVILRVNEARDLGEFDRFKFYHHTKTFMASPPDVLRVDEKHLREYNVLNVLGFVITTNQKTDGIYLMADDRRHLVAWSPRTKEDFAPNYWNEIWGYYNDGGYGHVAAHLNNLDISGFDPKAPPPKTPAFWDIVNANIAPEDAEIADAIDALGNPDALTIKQLAAVAIGEAAELLNSKYRKALPHRLERCGYVSERGPSDGQWKLGGKRQTIYVKQALSPQQRKQAAKTLAEKG